MVPGAPWVQVHSLQVVDYARLTLIAKLLPDRCAEARTPHEGNNPRVCNGFEPINSPYPDLQVDATVELVAPYPPADKPTLLYRGRMLGRWADTRAVRSFTEGFEPALSEEQADRLADELMTGVGGLGEVGFALWPEPHISWWFQCNFWPHTVGWPEMVPPAAHSPGLAVKAAPGCPPELPSTSPASAGRSRVMFPALIGDTDEPIDEVRFYLVNFQVIQLADDVVRGEQLDPKALLQLRGGGWEIDIERRLDFAQAMHHMEERRGYAVTHNCRLRRKGSQGEYRTFTFQEAEPTLEAVQLFTAFVRGGMVGVALPVGYLSDAPVFEQWHVTSADPGRYPDPHRPRPYHGWYIWHDGLRLGAARWLPPLFDRFARMWWHADTELQSFWRKVLRGLVYTYTDAERMDESRGIVPACTALETLCWAILVETERWLTGGRATDGGENEFDKLTLAGKIRLLLRWAGISTEIPKTLPKLSQEAKGRNWDGPQVAIWVRNRVVHPDRRDQLADEIAIESLRLALWYTELVVLKLLGYDGYYRDRLDTGGIKRVPWATE